eukprot:8135706-Alexandrium_andersonii.AAC.1
MEATRLQRGVVVLWLLGCGVSAVAWLDVGSARTISCDAGGIVLPAGLEDLVVRWLDAFTLLEAQDCLAH